MDKYHLFFTQEPELIATAAQLESARPQSRLLQAELVEQALSKETLPERLREKLSMRQSLETSGSEFRRYFTHLESGTPVQERREKSQEHREKLQQRLQERKEGK